MQLIYKQPPNAWLLGAIFALSVVGGSGAHYVFDYLGVTSPVALHDGTLIVQDCLLIALCIVVLRMRRSRWSAAQLGAVNFKAICDSIVLCAAVFFFARGAQAIITLVGANISSGSTYRLLGYHQYKYFLTLSTGGYFLVVISRLTLGPIAEEMFFRGLLLPLLCSKFKIWIALLVTSMIFTALHFNKPLYAYPGIFVFSLVACILYLKYGSLWVCVILHVLNNTMSFIYEYVLNFHTSVDPRTFARVNDWAPELAMLAISFLIGVLFKRSADKGGSFGTHGLRGSR